MKISILDDYHDTLRALDSFANLSGHDVEVWNDHVQDVDALAERLRETEALVLIRERTEIRVPQLLRGVRGRPGDAVASGGALTALGESSASASMWPASKAHAMYDSAM